MKRHLYHDVKAIFVSKDNFLVYVRFVYIMQLFQMHCVEKKESKFVDLETGCMFLFS